MYIVYSKLKVITAMCIYMPTDAVAFSRAVFGAGTGPIYLNTVDCSGSENKLINCSRSSFLSCPGGHSWDAGVRCQGTQCPYYVA